VGGSRLLAALLGFAAVAVAVVAVARDTGSSGATSEEPPPGFAGATPGRKPVIFDIGSLVFDYESRDALYREARGLGAEGVRVLVPWGMVAPQHRPAGFDPTDPADPNYDFGTYDSVLQSIKQRGMRILLVPTGPVPRWASETGNSDVADPDPGEFGAFVRALARRYNGRFAYRPPGGQRQVLPEVDIWSIWNEPNLSIFLQPQIKDGRDYSPLLYRKLYLAAQRAIESEDPEAPILIGETAPTGSTDSVAPIPFVRETLCLDSSYQERPNCPEADEDIDAVGWAAHPYSLTGRAPFEPVTAPNFVTMSALGTLEETLDRAADAGAIGSDLPIYITEFGVQSVPDPNSGVSLDAQAEYISIAEKIANEDPRVATFAQYLMRDDPPQTVRGTPYGGFESGLKFFDGNPKPAYPAFRLPLAIRRLGERVSIWGIIQPYMGPTDVEVRIQDPGQPAQPLRRLGTDQAGVYSFGSGYEPGRLWQVVWTSPVNGKTFRSPWYRSYEFAQPASSGAG
jgi:hypothetical protein